MSSSIIRKAHGHMIFSRRVEVLANEICKLLPRDCRVLDIGSGSGDIAVAVMRGRPDVKIEGVDVLVRPGTAIPVTQFDGHTLPFDDDSFDCAMLIDVLHHTDDPAELLSEAARVVTGGVVLKDHYRDPLLGRLRLRLMDWVGNAPHGVRLPYNYLNKREWAEIWKRLGLQPKTLNENIPLYPAPLSMVFGTGLHLIAFLTKARTPVVNAA